MRENLQADSVGNIPKARFVNQVTKMHIVDVVNESIVVHFNGAPKFCQSAAPVAKAEVSDSQLAWWDILRCYNRLEFLQ